MDKKYSYLNAICIDDYSKLQIRSNWYNEVYECPYFMISECKNTTNKLCKSKEEIQEFVRETEFQMSTLHTEFDENMYEEELHQDFLIGNNHGPD